jgi:hypothetical protein
MTRISSDISYALVRYHTIIKWKYCQNKIAKIDNLDKWLHENRLLNTKEIKMNPSGAFFTYIFMI